MSARTLSMALATVALAGCSSDRDPAPVAPWSRTYGNVADQITLIAALDPSGEIALTGTFSGGIDFGKKSLNGSGFDDIDVFFARLDAKGDAVWSGSTGSVGPQEGRGIAFDWKGNTVACGYFTSTVDFGKGKLTALSRDIYVAKFDPEGKTAWAKHFSADDGGPAGVGESDPMGIAVDQQDDVVIAGYFTGTIGFGGAPLETISQSTFVAKLSPEGHHVWSRALGGNGHQASAVAVDADGSVLLAGTNYDRIQFGGHDFLNDTSSSDGHAYVARLGADGEPLWLTQLGGRGTSNAYALTIDPTGYVIVAGNFEGKLELGDATLTSATGTTGFVAKLTAGGAPIWVKAFDGGHGVVRAVATDAIGNVFFTGDYTGAPSFGGERLPLRERGGAYLVELDAFGNHVSSRAFGNEKTKSSGSSVATIGGDVVLAGSFDGKIDLGNGPVLTAGLDDLFLARLRP